MKMYGGVEVQINTFFTSALGGGKWSASWPSQFTLRERPPATPSMGGQVAPELVWIL